MFTAVNRSIAWADVGGGVRFRGRATGRGPCDGSGANRSFRASSNAESFVSSARKQARTPTDAAVPVRLQQDGSDGRQESEEVGA